MKDDKIIIFTSALQGLMVFIPLNKQSFLSYSTVSLDYEWFIFLVANIHIKPLLNHKIVFFEAASWLVFIKTKHHIWSTKLGNSLLYVIRVVLELLVLLQIGFRHFLK